MISQNNRNHFKSLIIFALLGTSLTTLAVEQAGTIKTLQGRVEISRGGEIFPAEVGSHVSLGDVVSTGNSSFAGITMLDNTRMTAGPNTSIIIEKFSFNTTTHEGELSTDVQRGTLSVISGQIAKTRPDAVKFSAGELNLGVRGTEFIIEAAGE